MNIIPLTDLGLMTIADVAARFGVSPRAVQLWINDGLLPVVVVGNGERRHFLLRSYDVSQFVRPPRGRPTKGAKS